MEVLLILPIVALLLAGLRYVPEDTVLTVHRFGRYVRTLTPGLRFTLPLLDKVAHRVRLIGHHVDVSLAGETPARAEVYYQILEPERAGDVLDRVDVLVGQRASHALGALDGKQTGRDAHLLADALKRDLNQDLGTLGLRVTRCDLHFDAAA